MWLLADGAPRQNRKQPPIVSFCLHTLIKITIKPLKLLYSSDSCSATPALHFAPDSQSPSIWRSASRTGAANQRRRPTATAKLVCGVLQHSGSARGASGYCAFTLIHSQVVCFPLWQAVWTHFSPKSKVRLDFASLDWTINTERGECQTVARMFHILTAAFVVCVFN